jgi:16S rRNA (guanine527-N7)-methyltransferase
MDQMTLMAQLERARSLGFLGPGPVLDHVEHAAGFVAELAAVHGRVIDLGSGGGVPGLVVAIARPDLEVILVDAMGKRCRFLEAAVAALGVGQVIEGRAEVLGRGPLRGTASAVLARSFGPPAATAECAAPLLHLGGLLLVSEPPASDGQRWPAEPLAELGLSLRHRTASSPVLQVLEQTAPCPERYPRRDGMPGKRLLF